jgi:hypothetical protein
MKGILDKEKVLDMREQYFRFMTENGDTGILAKGTNPRDGISGEDWRNFLLPGALRLFNGLKDEDPSWTRYSLPTSKNFTKSSKKMSKSSRRFCW